MRIGGVVLGLAFSVSSVFAQAPAPSPSRSPASKLDAAPDEMPTNVVKVLRTSNKAQTNRYVPKVYEFTRVNPYEVIRFVRRVMEIEEGAFFTFQGVQPDSGRIMVVCPSYQIPYLDNLMAQLDRPGLTSSSADQRDFYRLKHRTSSDPHFVSTVKGFMNSSAIAVADVETNSLYLEDAPSGNRRALEALAKELDVPRQQVDLNVSLYEVDLTNDNAMGLDFHSWKNGPGRNLFAVGAYANYNKFYQDRNLGDRMGAVQDFNPSAGHTTAGLPAQRFHSEGANVAYFFDVPTAFLDFLVVKQKARVLTSTRLSALNTETATLQTGDKILYYYVKHNPSEQGAVRPPGYLLDPFGDWDLNKEWVDQGPAGEATEAQNDRTILNLGNEFVLERITTAANGLAQKEAQYPDSRVVLGKTAERRLGSVLTGVYLRIKPTISTDLINMDVESRVVNHTGYSDDGTPVLNNRGMKASIKLKDGQEIVLGGLVRERNIKSANKIPFLGSIPYLGYLFGGETGSNVKSLVVVVLSPEVVKGPSNVKATDQSLMSKAKGEESIPLPATSAGFDKYLMGR
ncbi:MAG: hypothetical protein FJ279_07295 [Planctomycetes bacterium]|nr:hypothetical protein [Planctomycetota bacterium]